MAWSIWSPETARRLERTPDDQYQSFLFPNYHCINFTVGNERLHATMYRVADPETATPVFEPKDEFDVDFAPLGTAGKPGLR